VTNAPFPEIDVLELSEGIFFVRDRGVISEEVTNFLQEESSFWGTGADVDEQGENPLCEAKWNSYFHVIVSSINFNGVMD
jgi:hypothetical protein